jgi:hypothetical protein
MWRGGQASRVSEKCPLSVCGQVPGNPFAPAGIQKWHGFSELSEIRLVGTPLAVNKAMQFQNDNRQLGNDTKCAWHL